MTPITAPILWYFFGDTACLMAGGRFGLDHCITDALSEPGVDAQAVVDDTGSDTAPPGMAGIVADVLATHPDRWPGLPRWTTADWPLGWQVRFVGPAQPHVDALIFQPGCVAFRWPPVGGGSLGVSIANVRPIVSEPHTVRYGEALIQAADTMVTTPQGRKVVLAAADRAGSIDRVDALAIMEGIDRDLQGPKAPPPSFTARINSALMTTETQIGVNGQGGVDMEIGWIEVPDAQGSGDPPPTVEMVDYPCGGFTS